MTTETKPATSTAGLVRAAPRRARKDPNEAPVFLQKTFQIVDSAPPDIAGWSENGDTFIVKDMEKFADLLPRFFKHKNFRSFVRQLNFYGFRKLRTDGALISERPSHWWEFRHDKFRQGRPDMLVQIKRANHYENNGTENQGEMVEELKAEVNVLRERMDEMAHTIEQLTGLVDTLLNDSDSSQSKKRRLQGILQASRGATLQVKQETATATSTPSMVTSSEQGRANGEGAGIGENSNNCGLVPLEADEAQLLAQLSLDSSAMPVGEDFSDDYFDRSLDLTGFDFSFRSSSTDGAVGVSDSGVGTSSISGAGGVASGGTGAGASTAIGTANVGGHAQVVNTPATFGLTQLSSPSRSRVKMDVDAVEMPPVAPYLATAAIGAFFTTLAAQPGTHAAPNAPGEGAPLMRTMSQGGIAVQT